MPPGSATSSETHLTGSHPGADGKKSLLYTRENVVFAAIIQIPYQTFCSLPDNTVPYIPIPGTGI